MTYFKVSLSTRNWDSAIIKGDGMNFSDYGLIHYAMAERSGIQCILAQQKYYDRKTRSPYNTINQVSSLPVDIA